MSNMIAVPVGVGARGIDSEPFSHGADLAHCQALKASGIEVVLLYLGAVSAESVANVLAAGMGFVPVTYAAAIEGPDPGTLTVEQLMALSIPKGTSVILDVEGPSSLTDPAGLITKINTWGDIVQAAGYLPGIYVGSPQPLTSAELTALHVFRYMRGQGSMRDRNNALVEPGSGWCGTQMWPSRMWAGVWSDLDVFGQDYHQRSVVMCAAADA